MQTIFWPDIARVKKLELAFSCLNSRPYLSYSDEIITLLDQAAHASVLAEQDLVSPLVEYFKDTEVRYSPAINLGWCYERAFWFNHQDVSPEQYFSFTVSEGFLFIESKNQNGGYGSLVLRAGDARKIFRQALRDLPNSYDPWSHDIYPVERACSFVLRKTYYREHDDETVEIPEGLIICAEAHPSNGSIYFGERQQELKQLAAFCKISKEVMPQLEQSQNPSKDDRLAAESRIRQFLQIGKLQFMPSDGFCYRCKRDVTKNLPTANADYDPTGCPLCGWSWCE